MSKMFSVGHFLMYWASNRPSSAEEMRHFLTKVEESVRKDEQKKLSDFVGKLRDKMGIEIDAHIAYLEGDTEDVPQQIHLNLEEDV